MSDAERVRLPVLDGWRGISILVVLATHLLPLGPKPWQLNSMAGPMGMALFFTLSGFLITGFLIRRTDVVEFLIRRVFRVVPIAWLGLAFALPYAATPLSAYAPNFLFVANLPPVSLVPITSHYWSLCVEIQFYVGIALVVLAFGKKGLFVVIPVCLAVTVHRLASHATVDIVTWRRVDEILAGSILALVHYGQLGARVAQLPQMFNPYALVVLLALCSHPSFEWLNYLRPYVAALLVGSTLTRSQDCLLVRILHSRTLAYVAAVSYALYVVHHILMYTWLGEGDSKMEKYLKRPMLLLVTFAAAHLSTFYVERPLIQLGRKLSATLRAQRT